MKAVILAGGLGTRFAEETDIKPKPMIEVGGMPIIWHIMKIYSAYDINDFVICLGYKGYVIKEYFQNYFLHMSNVTFDVKRNSMEVHDAAAEPWRVTLVDTGEKTMIGGRIKRILPYLGDDKEFCLTYGDGVGDVDVRAAIDLHRTEGRLATVTATQPPGRFGSINYEGHRVTGFQEKPMGDGGWINGGFFVLSPRGRALHRGRRDGVGTGADAEARGRGRAQRLFSSRLLAADGHVARQASSRRSLGVRQGAMETLVSGDGERSMRILITGNMGYVGPVLTRFLRSDSDDAELIGFDAGFFGHSLTGAELPARGAAEPAGVRRHPRVSGRIARRRRRGRASLGRLERPDGQQVRGGHRRNQPAGERPDRATGGRARGQELRLRLELQHVRLRRRRRAQGDRSHQPADRLRPLEDRVASRPSPSSISATWR